MIISYSKNFCFVRVPKTGSTSASMTMLSCGILDPNTDYCSQSIELGEPFGNYQKSNLHKILEAKDRTHHRVKTYRELNLIPASMTTYCTIRHPVERFISMAYFIYSPVDLNLIWDQWKDAFSGQPLNTECIEKIQNLKSRILQPQSYWIDEDTICWDIERLDYHLVSFLKNHNIEIDSVPRLRHNLSRPNSVQLSQDRIKEIESHYSLDLELWHKAKNIK